MNNKDVIYIDIEDDITAIIGKVKLAGNRVVALVPPKRVGVLQSAVNLKLLQKAAASAQKHVVLITNERSLITLAAGVKMPVAKNLQSRPEIPSMDAPATDTEEVIDGQTIPVGELASALGSVLGRKPVPTKNAEEKADLGDVALEAAAVEPATTDKKDASKSNKPRIPNFATFRKRLFLIGGGVVLLIAFLVWALVFAPHATITITAKTTAVNINKTLSLDTGAQQSDPAKLQLKPVQQQVKKAVTTEFDATGSKDIGDKAKGTVTVRNCDIPSDFTVPKGTRFVGDNGKSYVSTAAVEVPEHSGPSSSCTQSDPNEAGQAEVGVEAVELGPESNVAAQTYSISGYSDKVDGVGTAMAGGTRETVKVVSQADIDKAKDLLPKPDQTAAQAELKQLFTAQHIVIQESFEVTTGAMTSAPNVGEQAARAKLTQETTYTIIGLLRSEVNTILHAAVDEALRSQSDYQAYGYGEDKISFQDYERTDASKTKTRIVTAGFIGPKIDVEKLAQQLAGQRYGEIQALVNNIPGVQNVSIDLSPFWVSRAPSADKIDIKFTVANG